MTNIYIDLLKNQFIYQRNILSSNEFNPDQDKYKLAVKDINEDDLMALILCGAFDEEEVSDNIQEFNLEKKVSIIEELKPNSKNENAVKIVCKLWGLYERNAKDIHNRYAVFEIRSISSMRKRITEQEIITLKYHQIFIKILVDDIIETGIILNDELICIDCLESVVSKFIDRINNEKFYTILNKVMSDFYADQIRFIFSQEYLDNVLLDVELLNNPVLVNLI